MSNFDTSLETECVGCGRLAIKYCDGWISSAPKQNEYGSFSVRIGCGYPVCEDCVCLTSNHNNPPKHEPK